MKSLSKNIFREKNELENVKADIGGKLVELSAENKK